MPFFRNFTYHIDKRKWKYIFPFCHTGNVCLLTCCIIVAAQVCDARMLNAHFIVWPIDAFSDFYFLMLNVICYAILIINSETFRTNANTVSAKPMANSIRNNFFSTEGFSNDYSIMYHCHPPTQIIKTELQQSVAPTVAEEKCCSTAALKASKLSRKKTLDSRKPVLVNNDCHIVICRTKGKHDGIFL